MMATDSNNDIFLKAGKIHRVTGGAAVVQLVRSRLQTYLGEWFLDTDFGVPYFEDVFRRPAVLSLIELVIKKAIRETPGVEEVKEFDMVFDKPNRRLTISYDATTTYGDVKAATVNWIN
ncbi:MAG: hypothetical protein DRJ03_03205 [Chloroflexi bacterium]|nr:MAG: hypothetical protein DRJ03_03205 [Chloroflexota bacterium]